MRRTPGAGSGDSSVTLSEKDRTILRDLAKQKAEIASLPVHKEKAELWRKLNRLETVRQ